VPPAAADSRVLERKVMKKTAVLGLLLGILEVGFPTDEGRIPYSSKG